LLSASASGNKAVAMPRRPQRIHFFSRKFHFKRKNDSIKVMTMFYKNSDKFDIQVIVHHDKFL